MSKEHSRHADFATWRPYIRALVYPVLFEHDPAEGAGQVIAHIIRGDAKKAREYRDAIEQALLSEDRLSEFFATPVSERIAREFLETLAQRLDTV